MTSAARTNRRLRIIGLSLLGVLVLVSVLTAPPKSDTVGGPLLTGATVDARVLSILQRSCQDCHSGTTHYPWYSYVAPVSLLIKNDVEGGRRHLDLSRWSEYPLVKRERSLSEIANQVKDRDMPLPQYLLIHKSAKLSDDEISAVFQWTQAERARLIARSQP